MNNQFDVIFNQSNDRASKLIAAMDKLEVGSDGWCNLLELHRVELDRMFASAKASTQLSKLQYTNCGSVDLRLPR